MQNLESNKLVGHIEEAKDWLNKAQEEYSQDNPVRGEIILNLAQAEVKHAWELSRQRSVGSYRNHQRSGMRRFSVKTLTAAASLLLVLGLAFGMGRFLSNDTQTKISGNVSHSAASKTPSDVSENSGAGPVDTISKNNPIVFSQPTQNPVASKGEENPNHQTVVDKPTAEPVAAEPEPSKDNTVRENQGSQTRPQPVSQLQIDEDALTKEANQSLRQGK